MNIINKIKDRSSSVFSILDQGVISGTSFLLAFFLGLFLSPNEYGAYSLSLSVLMFINGIQSALSTTPLNVKGARLEGEDLVLYFQTLFKSHVFYGITVSIIIMITLPIIKAFAFDTQLLSPFLGLGIAFFVIQLQEFLRRLLYFTMKTKKVFLIDLLSSSITIIVVLGFNYVGVLKGSTVYFAIGIGNIVGILCFYVVLKHIFKGMFSFKLRSKSITIKENLIYGKWLLGSHVFYWIGNQSYLFASSIYLSMSVTAKIAITQNLVNAVNIVVMGIQNIAMPIASKKLQKYGMQSLKKYINKLILLTLLFVGSYGIILSLYGENIINILYNNKYSQVQQLMLLWSISFLIASLNRMFMIFLNTVLKNKINFYIYLFNALLSMVFIIPITKFFGANGMAIWTIVSGIIMFVINFIVFLNTREQ